MKRKINRQASLFNTLILIRYPFRKRKNKRRRKSKRPNKLTKLRPSLPRSQLSRARTKRLRKKPLLSKKIPNLNLPQRKKAKMNNKLITKQTSQLKGQQITKLRSPPRSLQRSLPSQLIQQTRIPRTILVSSTIKRTQTRLLRKSLRGSQRAQ